MYLVIDTETTGFLKAATCSINEQPRIVEFAAVLTDGQEILEELSFLVNPQIPLPEKITEITGIKQEDLNDQKPISDRIDEIMSFFSKGKTFIAHNMKFDKAIIDLELQRVNRPFHWGNNLICTMEGTRKLQNKILSLSNLHEHLFKSKPENAHRALYDAKTTAKCHIELLKRRISLIPEKTKTTRRF